MIVVIPMAGGDEAFRERGYGFCKPLVEVRNRVAEEEPTRAISAKIA